MLTLKEKELLFTWNGFTVHRPDLNESVISIGVIFLLCMALNFRFPAPFAWGLIGVVSMAAAAFDLIPPEKPLRTLLLSFIAGVTIAFIAV